MYSISYYRFIPDDMSFDDRQADSVATEDTIPAEFTPAEYVNSFIPPCPLTFNPFL